MEENRLHKFLPFLSWWPLVNKNSLKSDLFAGITGAIVALPQGVAFALIAGMPPIYGLYTAMISPIIAALFGSSRHMVSGPATAISIVIFSSISPFAEPGTEAFISLVLILTVMTGVIQLAMGFAKLGTLVNFVSHTVVIGFTAGAAILIAMSQLKHVLGIPILTGSSFTDTISQIFNQPELFNPYAFLIAIATLITAIVLKKISRQIPFLLIAMLVGAVLAYFLDAESNGIELVGEMPASLPQFRIPDFTWEHIQKLSSSAFAVALLGLIEAVAIARSIAVQSHQRIDGNQEFIGQGLSNFVGGFFSCFAGSGSFTRSGVNVQAGGITPMASVFSAVILMIIVLFVAPFAAYLPMPAMGGIILFVAYNLIDFKHIKEIIKVSNRESTVLLMTFLSTLLFELEFAIYIGVIFSLIFYLRLTSRPKVIELASDKDNNYHKLTNIKRKKHLKACPQIKILRIDGSLFFGSVEHVSNRIEKICKDFNGHLLLNLSGVNLIDLAGANLLVQEVSRLKEQKIQLMLCNMKKNVRDYLDKGDYNKSLGDAVIYKDEIEAIDELYKLVDLQICSTCALKVFKQCRAAEPENV